MTAGTHMAFVCAKEDEQGPDRTHETAVAMVRCSRCGQHAIGGYWCLEDDCGHDDVDPADQLTGHGEGRCEIKEEKA